MYHPGIATRAVGQYPLSIATSLAIESALGIHPDHQVPKPPLMRFQELWINVRTLFRNLMGSLESDTAGSVLAPTLSETIQIEMDTIRAVVRDATNSTVRVVFYMSNYMDLEKQYPKAVTRRDSTEKQKIFTILQNESLQKLLKDLPPEAIKVFKLKLTPHAAVAPKVLILTHIAYDLFSWFSFRDLTLLESHTGAIKPRAQWYTKYFNPGELSAFPFREDLVQMLGDTQTFRPMDSKVRKALIEVATQYRWSPVVTYEKIKYSAEQIRNPVIKELVLDLISRFY